MSTVGTLPYSHIEKVLEQCDLVVGKSLVVRFQNGPQGSKAFAALLKLWSKAIVFSLDPQQDKKLHSEWENFLQKPQVPMKYITFYLKPIGKSTVDDVMELLYLHVFTGITSLDNC